MDDDTPLFDDAGSGSPVELTPDDRRRLLAGLEAAAFIGDTDAIWRLRRIDEAIQISEADVRRDPLDTSPAETQPTHDLTMHDRRQMLRELETRVAGDPGNPAFMSIMDIVNHVLKWRPTQHGEPEASN